MLYLQHGVKYQICFSILNPERVLLEISLLIVFLLQMDDEDTLLPRKLQAALEQALERKSDLINQDSDSESDEGKRGWEQVLFTVESLWDGE